MGGGLRTTGRTTFSAGLDGAFHPSPALSPRHSRDRLPPSLSAASPTICSLAINLARKLNVGVDSSVRFFFLPPGPHRSTIIKYNAEDPARARERVFPRLSHDAISYASRVN